MATTDMFPFVSNEKYPKELEGVPTFPGPFHPRGDNYMNNQERSFQNWGPKSQHPLDPRQPPQSCTQYTNEAPMMPPYNPNTEIHNVREQFTEQNVRNDSEGQNARTHFVDPNLSDPKSDTGFGTIMPMFKNDKLFKCEGEIPPLIDATQRPVDQFSHNNMVPYFGAKITQNMRGTGVPQGDNNDCDGTTDGFAYQTPWQTKLAAFTGCDETYMHKRETGPMFSPGEQQTGWVNGSPDFRPEMDRYTTSIYLRNNEAPIEKINVGKGIALDYTTPASGGLHQFTRLLPNNVSDYKANQLEGRVTAGKWNVDHPTSQYVEGPILRNQKLEWSQAQRPTMQSKFYNNSPSADNNGTTNYSVTTLKGKQSRTDTEVSAGFGSVEGDYIENFGINDPNCVTYGSAPVGKVMGSHVPAQSQELQSYRNVRETFKRGAAGYKESRNGNDGGYWQNTDQEQGTNRFDISLMPAKGPTEAGINREGWYANYTDRGDINPYVINATGTVHTGGVWSPNSYGDNQKTTMKETTLYSYAGNVRGTTNAQENKYPDQLKTTTKETTSFAYHGSPAGDTKAHMNKYQDSVRTTTKETTDFAYSGNAGSVHSAHSDRFMYDGNTLFNPQLNSGNNAMPSDKVLDRLSIKKDNRSMLERFADDATKTMKNLYNENFGRREHYGEISVDSAQEIPFEPDKFIQGLTGQWSMGGVQKFGNRQAAEVWNWFAGPERSNLLADPLQGNELSSIGKVSWNGLNEPSEQGPGTFASTNINVNFPTYATDENIGIVRQNEKKTDYVDYRNTDTTLVQALKDNPLSIYVREEKVNAPLPQFFSYVKPDDYSDRITSSKVNISAQEKQLYIDGSPQSVILGLGEQNPLMGITTNIPNTTPAFSGKSYSGDSPDLRVYDLSWTNDFGKYIEQFGADKFHDRCQNRALAFASEGYDISSQIVNNTFVQEGPRTNIPWGPHARGTPLTQLGGIWNGQVKDNTFNIVDRRAYADSMAIGTRPIANQYTQGLPGSLVSS